MFSWLRPLLAGVLHSFEPDHIVAVSVLASENATTQKKVDFITVFKSCRWALGHSVTLLLFGFIALFFRGVLRIWVADISLWAECLVGPVMIWLGVTAILRNHRMKKMMRLHKEILPHEHTLSDPIHLHGFSGEEIAMNPMNRSFWLGMLHGLAGTGGALTSVLVVGATTYAEALFVLFIESVGVILAMSVYSFVLLKVMSRFIERNIIIFKMMNVFLGLLSFFVGVHWVLKIFV